MLLRHQLRSSASVARSYSAGRRNPTEVCLASPPPLPSSSSVAAAAAAAAAASSPCPRAPPSAHRRRRSPSFFPAAAAAAAASGPSGSGSPAPGPSGSTTRSAAGAEHAGLVGGASSASSATAGVDSGKSYRHGQVRHRTVLRTVDQVVAAASAARTFASAPSAAASAAAAAAGGGSGSGSSSSYSTEGNRERGTYSSVDDDNMNEGGGVRLLVVVGVVLLDDPEWTEAAAAGAAAELAELAKAETQAAGGAAPSPSPFPSASATATASTAPAAPSPTRPVRVLLAQRPLGKSNAGLWEFPGGKVDPGETPEAALVRELREELSISVDAADLQPLTFASHTYPTFHLLMPLYVCRRWRGEPRGAEGQAVVWATGGEVSSYDLTPADIPLVPAVLAAMRHGTHSADSTKH